MLCADLCDGRSDAGEEKDDMQLVCHRHALDKSHAWDRIQLDKSLARNCKHWIKVLHRTAIIHWQALDKSCALHVVQKSSWAGCSTLERRRLLRRALAEEGEEAKMTKVRLRQEQSMV